MSGKVFQCDKCGNCCRPHGYVRLGNDEVEAIAAHIGVRVGEFTGRYTKLVDNRTGLSLTEHADGSCVFLSPDGECHIESVKPQQCRDFPVKWNYPGFERNCRAMKKETK